MATTDVDHTQEPVPSLMKIEEGNEDLTSEKPLEIVVGLIKSGPRVSSNAGTDTVCTDLNGNTGVPESPPVAKVSSEQPSAEQETHKVDDNTSSQIEMEVSDDPKQLVDDSVNAANVVDKEQNEIVDEAKMFVEKGDINVEAGLQISKLKEPSTQIGGEEIQKQDILKHDEKTENAHLPEENSEIIDDEKENGKYKKAEHETKEVETEANSCENEEASSKAQELVASDVKESSTEMTSDLTRQHESTYDVVTIKTTPKKENTGDSLSDRVKEKESESCSSSSNQRNDQNTSEADSMIETVSDKQMSSEVEDNTKDKLAEPSIISTADLSGFQKADLEVEDNPEQENDKLANVSKCIGQAALVEEIQQKNDGLASFVTKTEEEHLQNFNNREISGVISDTMSEGQVKKSMEEEDETNSVVESSKADPVADDNDKSERERLDILTIKREDKVITDEDSSYAPVEVGEEFNIAAVTNSVPDTNDEVSTSEKSSEERHMQQDEKERLETETRLAVNFENKDAIISRKCSEAITEDKMDSDIRSQKKSCETKQEEEEDGTPKEMNLPSIEFSEKIQRVETQNLRSNAENSERTSSIKEEETRVFEVEKVEIMYADDSVEKLSEENGASEQKGEAINLLPEESTERAEQSEDDVQSSNTKNLEINSIEKEPILEEAEKMEKTLNIESQRQISKEEEAFGSDEKHAEIEPELREKENPTLIECSPLEEATLEEQRSNDDNLVISGEEFIKPAVTIIAPEQNDESQEGNLWKEEKEMETNLTVISESKFEAPLSVLAETDGNAKEEMLKERNDANVMKLNAADGSEIEKDEILEINIAAIVISEKVATITSESAETTKNDEADMFVQTEKESYDEKEKDLKSVEGLETKTDVASEEKVRENVPSSSEMSGHAKIEVLPNKVENLGGSHLPEKEARQAAGEKPERELNVESRREVPEEEVTSRCEDVEIKSETRKRETVEYPSIEGAAQTTDNDNSLTIMGDDVIKDAVNINALEQLSRNPEESLQLDGNEIEKKESTLTMNSEKNDEVVSDELTETIANIKEETYIPSKEEIHEGTRKEPKATKDAEIENDGTLKDKVEAIAITEQDATTSCEPVGTAKNDKEDIYIENQKEIYEAKEKELQTTEGAKAEIDETSEEKVEATNPPLNERTQIEVPSSEAEDSKTSRLLEKKAIPVAGEKLNKGADVEHHEQDIEEEVASKCEQHVDIEFEKSEREIVLQYPSVEEAISTKNLDTDDSPATTTEEVAKDAVNTIALEQTEEKLGHEGKEVENKEATLTMISEKKDGIVSEELWETIASSEEETHIVSEKEIHVVTGKKLKVTEDTEIENAGTLEKKVEAIVVSENDAIISSEFGETSKDDKEDMLIEIQKEIYEVKERELKQIEASEAQTDGISKEKNPSSNERNEHAEVKELSSKAGNSEIRHLLEKEAIPGARENLEKELQVESQKHVFEEEVASRCEQHTDIESETSKREVSSQYPLIEGAISIENMSNDDSPATVSDEITEVDEKIGHAESEILIYNVENIERNYSVEQEPITDKRKDEVPGAEFITQASKEERVSKCEVKHTEDDSEICRRIEETEKSNELESYDKSHPQDEETNIQEEVKEQDETSDTRSHELTLTHDRKEKYEFEDERVSIVREKNYEGVSCSNYKDEERNAEGNEHDNNQNDESPDETLTDITPQEVEKKEINDKDRLSEEVNKGDISSQMMEDENETHTELIEDDETVAPCVSQANVKSDESLVEEKHEPVSYHEKDEDNENSVCPREVRQTGEVDTVKAQKDSEEMLQNDRSQEDIDRSNTAILGTDAHTEQETLLEEETIERLGQKKRTNEVNKDEGNQEYMPIEVEDLTNVVRITNDVIGSAKENVKEEEIPKRIEYMQREANSSLQSQEIVEQFEVNDLQNHDKSQQNLQKAEISERQESTAKIGEIDESPHATVCMSSIKNEEGLQDKNENVAANEESQEERREEDDCFVDASENTPQKGREDLEQEFHKHAPTDASEQLVNVAAPETKNPTISEEIVIQNDEETVDNEKKEEASEDDGVTTVGSVKLQQDSKVSIEESDEKKCMKEMEIKPIITKIEGEILDKKREGKDTAEDPLPGTTTKNINKMCEETKITEDNLDLPAKVITAEEDLRTCKEVDYDSINKKAEVTESKLESIEQTEVGTSVEAEESEKLVEREERNICPLKLSKQETHSGDDVERNGTTSSLQPENYEHMTRKEEPIMDDSVHVSENEVASKMDLKSNEPQDESQKESYNSTLQRESLVRESLQPIENKDADAQIIGVSSMTDNTENKASTSTDEVEEVQEPQMKMVAPTMNIEQKAVVTEEIPQNESSDSSLDGSSAFQSKEIDSFTGESKIINEKSAYPEIEIHSLTQQVEVTQDEGTLENSEEIRKEVHSEYYLDKQECLPLDHQQSTSISKDVETLAMEETEDLVDDSKTLIDDKSLNVTKEDLKDNEEANEEEREDVLEKGNLPISQVCLVKESTSFEQEVTEVEPSFHLESKANDVENSEIVKEESTEQSSETISEIDKIKCEEQQDHDPNKSLDQIKHKLPHFQEGDQREEEEVKQRLEAEVGFRETDKGDNVVKAINLNEEAQQEASKDDDIETLQKFKQDEDVKKEFHTVTAEDKKDDEQMEKETNLQDQEIAEVKIQRVVMKEEETLPRKVTDEDTIKTEDWEKPADCTTISSSEEQKVVIKENIKEEADECVEKSKETSSAEAIIESHTEKYETPNPTLDVMKLHVAEVDARQQDDIVKSIELKEDFLNVNQLSSNENRSIKEKAQEGQERKTDTNVVDEFKNHEVEEQLPSEAKEEIEAASETESKFDAIKTHPSGEHQTPGLIECCNEEVKIDTIQKLKEDEGIVVNDQILQESKEEDQTLSCALPSRDENFETEVIETTAQSGLGSLKDEAIKVEGASDRKKEVGDVTELKPQGGTDNKTKEASGSILISDSNAKGTNNLQEKVSEEEDRTLYDVLFRKEEEDVTSNMKKVMLVEESEVNKEVLLEARHDKDVQETPQEVNEKGTMILDEIIKEEINGACSDEIKTIKEGSEVTHSGDPGFETFEGAKRSTQDLLMDKSMEGEDVIISAELSSNQQVHLKEVTVPKIESEKFEAHVTGLECNDDSQKEIENHKDEARVADNTSIHELIIKPEGLESKISFARADTREYVLESEKGEVLNDLGENDISEKHVEEEVPSLMPELESNKLTDATELIDHEAKKLEVLEEKQDLESYNTILRIQETDKECTKEHEQKAEATLPEKEAEKEVVAEEIEKITGDKRSVSEDLRQTANDNLRINDTFPIYTAEKKVNEEGTILQSERQGSETTVGNATDSKVIYQEEKILNVTLKEQISNDKLESKEVNDATSNNDVSQVIVHDRSGYSDDVTLEEKKLKDKPENMKVIDATSSKNIAEVIEQVPDGEIVHSTATRDLQPEHAVEVSTAEKTNTDSVEVESAKISLFDMMQRSKRERPETKEVSGLKEEETKVEEEAVIESERKKSDEDKKEDNEEGDDQRKADSGSEGPVIVEAKKDMDVKVAHKKSHNILSGVGSKVKHSISKVRKAITGKHSHAKQQSPKSKDK